MRLATPAARDVAAARRGLIGQYMLLTKARLSALVVLTTAVGFVLARPGLPIDWLTLLWTVIGTSLAAGAANALNEVLECRRDAKMHRTRSRPLPAGTMSVTHGFVFAMVVAYAGVSVLAVLVNLFTAALALATIVLYVAVYTPLKVRTTTNTLVGAVCGAIPPVIGWVAASGTLDARALVLASILFVWQLPHFLALAWMYREDYARGGFRMLPVLDPEGVVTSRVVFLGSLMLIPVGLAATVVGIAGWVSALGALVLGLWMTLLAARLLRQRTDARARAVFLASLAYLPLVLCVMVLDRGPLG